MKSSAVAALLSVTMLLEAPIAAPAQGRPARSTAWIHHAVSTNVQAQAAFDRGLMDYYAYNPESAQHEFYTAADLDKHLAMAWWGIAISNAPNLNVDATDDRALQARDAIEQAKTLENYASVEDRAFIDAAAARFDDNSKASAQALLIKYRDALQRVAAAYPNDSDAAALYAESALYVAHGEVNPDRLTDAQKAARIASLVAVLPLFQASLAKFPKHVGLLHFYLHAAQNAGKSSLAVAAATQLASFSLRSEDSHLTHMPAHIFFDVGMYKEALDVSERSVAMDLAAFACCHPGYYSAPRYYHDHNVSFLLYALTETGRSSEAVAVARREDDPYYMAIQLVAARDWRGVLAVPNRNGNTRTLPFTRGLAYAKLGDAAMAQRSLRQIADAAPDSPYDVAVVSAMRFTLSAETAALEHDDAKALALLTQASAAATNAEKLGPEFPSLYYYSPHMALATLAARLGKTDIAKAALHAELSASPRSPEAQRALTQLASSH